jgi:Xaa-Pro aminopeptidase
MTPSERRSAIGREFEALEIDCLLVSALPNIRYLSGFTGSNGLLVLDPSGKDVLLTDPRYTLRAAEEADCSVKVVSGSLWAEAAAAEFESFQPSHFQSEVRPAREQSCG